MYSILNGWNSACYFDRATIETLTDTKRDSQNITLYVYPWLLGHNKQFLMACWAAFNTQPQGKYVLAFSTTPAALAETVQMVWHLYTGT